ncbi:DUF2813 domain-containing protein [Clostridium sp.]|uniref:DUF2813 domain-containing protein n=1 Tax=Clostridium sp. TaxID=1506 RepID=UPI00261224C5|nr:DUF2813 domain-containing protein [Clostridium sp.]
MEIILKQLTLKNFKGIKDLEINFSKTTNIFGENSTGKTTIFDGFSWLLFDKDSKGRSKFEIQTLDENNERIHGLEHQVSAILNIDGTNRTFTKTLKEKWVKQRGDAESELKGTTTTYEIDGIPVKLKEYQAAISEIINEDLFKMVTNPLFFPGMKDQEQRKILLDIVGDLEEESVINCNPSLNPLRDLLTDGIDNFNKRTKASISKLKDQVKSLPYRIDECNNSITEVDIEALEFRKRGIVSGVNSLDEQIGDSSKVNEEKLKLQDKLFELKSNKNSLVYEYKENADKPLIEIKNKISKLQKDLDDTQDDYKSLDRKKNQIFSRQVDSVDKVKISKRKQEALKDKWYEEKSKEFLFDENSTICPCCNRAYETENIEKIKSEALERFNQSKANRLAQISKEGKEYGTIINGLVAEVKEYEINLNGLNEDIKSINSSQGELLKKIEELYIEKTRFENSTTVVIPGLNELDKQIESLEEEIRVFKSNDNIELKLRKKALQEQLEEVNKQLNSKENNEKLLSRIEELKEEEKDLNVKIAALEGQLFLGEDFIRTKVELLEGKINEKSEGKVAFKLFNQQVNGGVSECCEALIEGVPFGNANTASQLNAGLSIISALSRHYGVQAPIFIDNRESVNELVNLNSQVINLIVSKDKKMKVEVI